MQCPALSMVAWRTGDRMDAVENNVAGSFHCQEVIISSATKKGDIANEMGTQCLSLRMFTTSYLKHY